MGRESKIIDAVDFFNLCKIAGYTPEIIESKKGKIGIVLRKAFDGGHNSYRRITEQLPAFNCLEKAIGFLRGVTGRTGDVSGYAGDVAAYPSHHVPPAPYYPSTVARSASEPVTRGVASSENSEVKTDGAA